MRSLRSSCATATGTSDSLSGRHRCKKKLYFKKNAFLRFKKIKSINAFTDKKVDEQLQLLPYVAERNHCSYFDV